MGKEIERRLVSKSDYARHRQVTPAMVTHWAKSARLVLVDGRVDLVATDALLAATLDPTRGGKGGRPAAQRQAAPVGASARQEPEAPAAPPVVTETAMSRATAADREASTALKVLRLEREAGRLVNREQYERTTETVFAGLRDAVMAIPGRIGTWLAAESDPRKCMDILKGELVAALNGRAEVEQALAERAIATSQ